MEDKKGRGSGQAAPRHCGLHCSTGTQPRTHLFLPRASFCIKGEERHKTEYLVEFQLSSMGSQMICPPAPLLYKQGACDGREGGGEGGGSESGMKRSS